jgi:hypothetical protein
MSPQERSQALVAAGKEPFNKRISSVSERFLGTPYGDSPLGEGKGKDPDPLIRFDQVDCLTFVEETMAMVLAPTDAEVVSWLNRIRYMNDAPKYEERNHLMEAQWLPSNIKKGFLADVTKLYGGASVRRAPKLLTRDTWKSKSGVALGLKPEEQLTGEFGLDIIPVEEALEIVKKVPAGTVLVAVRADRAAMVTRVTHVGFVLQTPKGTVLRHASRTFTRVVDEPLATFMKRNLGYAKWTVEGVSLFAVRSEP